MVLNAERAMQTSAEPPDWRSLEKRLGRLKPAQRTLAQSVVELLQRSEDGTILLATLLESYLGRGDRSALGTLRQNKKRLNEELAALDADIELAVDESGKLTARRCYLRTPTGKTVVVQQLAEHLNYNYNRDRDWYVPPKAQSLIIEIPISYSHQDEALAREFHQLLQAVLNARGGQTRYVLRRDKQDVSSLHRSTHKLQRCSKRGN